VSIAACGVVSIAACGVVSIAACGDRLTANNRRP
jgi:hypothetical protein